MKKSVYSMGGMWLLRCPLRPEVENKRLSRLEADQHRIGGSSCTAADIAQPGDGQRLTCIFLLLVGYIYAWKKEILQWER